jgi:glycosyltransferase involved in cell wall biosynthesis
MKLAYLLNTYPAPSGTFIRGEIEALEAQGVTVTRLAVRRYDGQLVDAADVREQERTRYLLDGNVAGLCGATLKEAIVNPRGLLRALPSWLRLLRNAGGGFVRHTAYLMQAAALKQTTARLGVDHVHSHFSNNAVAVAMLSRRLGGPSYSFTAHGPDEFAEPERQSFPEKIGRAAFVIAISTYCRTLLMELARDEGARTKIHIARCGLALERFTVAPPIENGNRTLVCVGRLCPQKGQVHIPAAVAALKPRFPDIKVVLVGDGESRNAIEREIERHGVAREVVLHGWATNEEVRRLIAESRALLLPSYAEGLPIVIMETFGIGRPVISTTIAGIPELVDSDCGWLVAPGDHEALVAAMGTALAASPETLHRMGLEGRRRVDELHDRRRLATRLRQLFGEAQVVGSATGPVILTQDAPAPCRD